MKITLYTTNTCEFSKKEKEFLTANNLPFEEKNLESNREFLTEMLAVSNNFAGTPVTKVEHDDGKIVVLKGFTEKEFKMTLNMTPSPTDVPVTPNPVPAPEPAIPQPVTPTPAVEPVPPSLVVETPVAPSPVAEVPPAPVQTSPVDAQLNSILSDLQSKAAEPAVTAPSEAPAAVTPPAAQPPAADLPNIPEPNFS